MMATPANQHPSPQSWRTFAGLFALLLALLLPTLANAFVNTNGQAASLVLGQPDFTTNTDGTSASGMSLTSGVTVDPTSGKLFIADSSNNRVLRFASTTALSNGAAAEAVLGQPDFTMNTFGTTISKLKYAYAIMVGSDGTLWVADTGNNRVLRFTNAASKANGASADGVLGQPNFTTATNGTTASTLNSPIGVAVGSDGTLWVADTGNNRVLRFTNAVSKANGANADGVLGQPNFTTATNGTTASTLNGPRGVAVGSDGTLWVADSSNNRVLRFANAVSKANGTNADGVLGQPNFTTVTDGTTASTLNSPFGVAVGSDGTLWVADTSNNRVLRFANAASNANGAADGVLGQTNFTTATAGTTASTLKKPFGVAVGSDGTLWVADTFNYRILRFEAPAPRFTNPAPAAGVVGTAYSTTFTAKGTPAPSFAIVAGSLPPGLTFNPTTGVLSGTPTQAGSYTFTLTASNGVGTPANQQVTLVINAAASSGVNYYLPLLSS